MKAKRTKTTAHNKAMEALTKQMLLMQDAERGLRVAMLAVGYEERKLYEIAEWAGARKPYELKLENGKAVILNHEPPTTPK